MNGTFRMSEQMVAEGAHRPIRWVSNRVSTGARHVIAGQVEQWIDREMRILGPGDAAFVPPGVVHGTFHAGEADARMLAISGPDVGDGFEMVGMSGEAPWSGLRN
jgi:quercetin dioxygenase-like cupin family protein